MPRPIGNQGSKKFFLQAFAHKTVADRNPCPNGSMPRIDQAVMLKLETSYLAEALTAKDHSRTPAPPPEAFCRPWRQSFPLARNRKNAEMLA